MKKIFRPNIDDLQKEWVDQPELIHQMTRKAAERRNDMDVAKAAMELIEAELLEKIKNKPYKYGFTDEKSPTQAAIAAAAQRHEKFQKAQKIYLAAKLEHAMSEAAVTAAATKKTALENLVVLWARDYGGNPRVPKDEEERVANKVKERAGNFKVSDPKTQQKRTSKK